MGNIRFEGKKIIWEETSKDLQAKCAICFISYCDRKINLISDRVPDIDASRGEGRHKKPTRTRFGIESECRKNRSEKRHVSRQVRHGLPGKKDGGHGKR